MAQVSVHTWNRLKNPIIREKFEFLAAMQKAAHTLLFVVFFRYYYIYSVCTCVLCNVIFLIKKLECILKCHCYCTHDGWKYGIGHIS